MERSRCGTCGYWRGEGYFTNCQLCIDHNAKQPLARRAAITRSVGGSDDGDFEVTPKKTLRRAPGTSYVSQGLPRVGVHVHSQAVAAASKRQAQSKALQLHVRGAKQMPTTDKTLAYVNSIRSPAAAPVTAAAPAVSKEDANVSVAELAPAPAAAPVTNKQVSDLEVADGYLAASDWRRCQRKEKNFLHPSLEHDGYEVLSTDRDGDCLFHCFIEILTERQLVDFSPSKKENVAQMRSIIVNGFVQVQNELSCHILGGDRKAFQGSFECSNLIAMRSGKGGRLAYGGEAEIAMFGVLYGIAVRVFAPETMNGEFVANIDLCPEEVFLLTLGWNGKKRSPGTDHWQRVKHSQPSPLVPVQQQQAPLVPVQQQQAVTPAQRKEAAKLLAQEQQKADDAAACERARNFIAAGGRFDYTEEDLQDYGDAHQHDHGDAQHADIDEVGAEDDHGEDERRETVETVGHGQEQLSKEGCISKRKVTHWIHETRITCLRLIQRMNPWTAKDSGLMWQQIADTMHRDTEHVTSMNARGKEVSCQVHSNGSALNMWYNRQLQILQERYSEGKERTKSGQTGQLQQAITERASQTGEKRDEVEAEWAAIMSLRALQQDAAKAALLKKEKINAQKSLKNEELPEAVMQLACDDDKIRMQAIRLLEKKMKTFAQEEKTLASAHRCAVMSPQQIHDKELLEKLKQQRRDAMGKSDDDSAEDERHMSSDTNRGRGKNNLKRSFDMMSEKMCELAQFMKEDNDDDKGTTTLDGLNDLLNGIDADVKGGLKLEADERAQLRMIYLRQYAKHRIHAKKDKPS